jgi:hypothetical protein
MDAVARVRSIARGGWLGVSDDFRKWLVQAA